MHLKGMEREDEHRHRMCGHFSCQVHTKQMKDFLFFRRNKERHQKATARCVEYSVEVTIPIMVEIT